jgi:hypothetical protein
MTDNSILINPKNKSFDWNIKIDDLEKESKNSNSLRIDLQIYLYKMPDYRNNESTTYSSIGI